MQRKSFGSMKCPIARSLEQVGEWWSILILRDALAGSTRFDQFQKSLGIAPNILTRRLAALVASGLLIRSRYQEHPPRHEYLLTDAGRDFQPVVVSLLAWGNRHFAADGECAIVVDAATSRRAEPVLIDRITGKQITYEHFRLAAGPAAPAEGVGFPELPPVRPTRGRAARPR